MYTKKNVFIILLCLVSFISQAQLKVSEHRISWYPELKAFLPDTQERIAFENFAMMDEYKELPCYIVPLNEYSTEKEVSVYLSNEQVREATPQETAYLQMYEDLIAPEFNIRSQIQEYRYEFRTIACVLPIRKNQSTGNYELLTTFKLLSNTKNTDSLSVFNSKNNSSIPKNESVLAQAPFFKLRIQQNGIYRLTFQEMKKYGILQDEIKSSQIALFGNPAGMLANDNKNEKYNDDLMEIPIAIYDGGDGQFNANDYLLFYGQSATTWQWDQKVEEANFTHQVNYYDDYTYYFLSANYTQGTRKRIQDAVEVNMLPSKTIQQFIDYQYYEKDLFNPCNEGQNWVGEIFREQGAVHDFDFVFPDIILDSVIKINMALAASSASTFTLSSTQAFLAEDSMAANLNVQISLSENFCLATQSAQYRCKLRQNTPRFRLKYSKENAVISDGYLDYFNFQYYRKLKIAQGFLSFRSPEAIKNVVKFQIESLYGSVQVWKIDSLWNIENIKVTQKDKLYSFVRKDDHLAEFIAFDGNTFLSLKALDIQKIDTQNLHALNSIEYVIVAHPDFQKEAQELGELHRQNNVKTAVLLTTQVYNEFSAGIVDPSAIRRLMKMLYDKAQENKELTPPSYLLLFGDASYDVKNVLNKNSNFIPTFEPVSNGSGDGDVGDDDFAYLGTNESSANAMPDIAVGRLPVSSTEQAQNVLAKIKRYMHPYLYKEETMDQTSLNFGDWKNVITFISDDGERFDQRYEDSGQFASAIYKEEPQMNIKKIYSDAYQRYSTPKGATYPDARKALHEGMDKGALFVGYMGHSGWNAWSDEKILILEDIYKWKNSYAYPMMFSSSCTFSYFDQVAQISGGELCVLTPNGGAISMVAASRTANIGSIEKIQSDFVRYAIQKQEGIPPSIGDAYLYTKIQNMYSSARRFILLGDPALKVALPRYDIQTTHINGKDINQSLDSLKAFSKMEIEGAITLPDGSIHTHFNGVLQVQIYDKFTQECTRGNQNSKGGYNEKVPYVMQQNVIYKGQSSVKNGKFTFTFIVPKDIAYNYGFGKISYYAYSDSLGDASGYFNKIVVGGFDTEVVFDTTPPTVHLYIDDKSFTDGVRVGVQPTIKADIFDDYGINTTGSGIGHDMILTLDGNTKTNRIVNDLFKYDFGSYTRGSLAYSLPELSPGNHTLELKVWNIYNMSTLARLDFIVEDPSRFRIFGLFNAPNPANTETSFYFTHNTDKKLDRVQIEICGLHGNLVGRFEQKMDINSSYVIGPIRWECKNTSGQRLSRGMYFYTIKLYDVDGNMAKAGQKLIVVN